VRGQRAHGIELDDRDAPAETVRGACQALADPPVADDAELAARREHIGERKHRGQRRLAGAVRVVEHVLALRVVRGDRRERQASLRLERAQPRHTGGRFLADALDALVQVGAVLRDATRELEAVVDHELRPGFRDCEQVGGELGLRNAVTRVHLDAALDERRTDGILRRERVAAGGDHLRPRVLQREHEAGGLRLQMHDDRDLASRKRPVTEAVAQRREHGHVLPSPLDAAVAFGREGRIGDVRHPENLTCDAG
jgi:hypothetical protein